MLVIKSPTKYPKQRGEHAYHADLILEPGDSLILMAGTAPYLLLASEDCPEGQLLHIHYEIAVEPENLSDVDAWQAVSTTWRQRDILEDRTKQENYE